MATELNLGLIVEYPHYAGIFDEPMKLSDGTKLNVIQFGHDPTNDEAQSLDIWEMPVVRYMALREHGLAVTAIPVFPARRFIQWMVEVADESDLHSPADLDGKRIGSHYYGHTDAVWIRGVLEEGYGLDLSAVSQFTVMPERVIAQPPPPYVTRIEGTTLNDLLLSGEIDAALNNGYGNAPVPGVRRLWDDPERAAAEWFASTKLFPMLHLILMRDSVLAEHPSAARDMYAMFEARKNTALARWDYGRTIPEEWVVNAMRSGFPTTADRSFLGKDPLPYGLEANRAGLERLIRYATKQKAIPREYSIEELFAPID